MKKFLKFLLILFIVIMVLCIGSVVAMYALKICPPEGPWVQPPWCGADSNTLGIKPTLESFLLQQPTLQGFISENIIGDQDPSFVHPQPTPIPAGVEMPLYFEVVLPPTTQEVNLVFQDNSYPMQRSTDYLYSLDGLTATTGDELSFEFTTPTLSTPAIMLTFDGISPLRVAANWTTQEKILKNNFIMGHTVMDAGGNIPAVTRTGTLALTMEAMQNDGAQWFSYDYYWSYGDMSLPEIINEITYDSSAASDEVLASMAEMAHNRGMKFFLLTELEWTIPPEERQQHAGDTIDEWMAYNNKVWSEGQQFIEKMGEQLGENPDDPQLNAYWDSWFEQFTTFMLHAAYVAEENDIEALALGKQVAGAMIPENDARWRKLIADVRQVYHGQITQALFTNQYSDWQSYGWLEDLDFITIYYYSSFSTADHPSLSDLVASFEQFNRNQFDPLFRQTQKPIVMLLPFQSRDHAAQQQWFEPMASAPSDVKQDWIAQADLYEAFFESTLDEPWLNGVMTWGYWITPDFPPEYSFESSSTVRSKPAALVIKRWFDLIEN